MKPLIGITMGDPASIGAELCVKAFMRDEVHEACRPIVIGDAAIIERAMRVPGLGKLEICRVRDVSQAVFQKGVISVLDMELCTPENAPLGRISAPAGDAAFQYVKKVIALAMDGSIDATVTNALNKEAMNLAGHHYAGHTEIYADFTNTRNYTMMLAYENLKVVHVSTHVSLRDACDAVRYERVLSVIRIAHEACLALGISHPRIGVAGLNPHCGEGGLFGREEIEQISPAVRKAQDEGICAEGPIPPDTVFSKARGGLYDIVVAMYHDQGHIPLKLLGFVMDEKTRRWQSVQGVNITLGLPIIRASVDHGTAFDQAGLGTASEESLVNAIRYAVLMAAKKRIE